MTQLASEIRETAGRTEHNRRPVVNDHRVEESDDDCSKEDASLQFFPKMGLIIMFMLILGIWLFATRTVYLAKNPDKYTDTAMLGVTFAGSFMAAMFILGFIGSCVRDPDLLVAGLIGAGTAMFMAGSQLIRILSAMMRRGRVYGNEQCVTDPTFFAVHKEYCIAQTVACILFNFITFLTIAALFNSTYDYWKYLTGKKETDQLKWTKNALTTAAARVRSNNDNNANLPAAVPTTHTKMMSVDSIPSCQKMKVSAFY